MLEGMKANWFNFVLNKDAQRYCDSPKASEVWNAG